MPAGTPTPRTLSRYQVVAARAVLADGGSLKDCALKLGCLAADVDRALWSYLGINLLSPDLDGEWVWGRK